MTFIMAPQGVILEHGTRPQMKFGTWNMGMKMGTHTHTKQIRNMNMREHEEKENWDQGIRPL